MSTLEELEEAVEDALKECRGRLRAFVDESAENRRANIGRAVKAAEKKIKAAIKKAWAEGGR